MSKNLRSSTPTLTDAQFRFLRVLQTTSTIPGVAICGLVLIAYAIVAFPLKARKYLDRVSLRLLIYALVFNIVLGIGSSTSRGGTTICKVEYFIFSFCSSCARSFIACIVINLQLILVHGVNSKRMEKFYVIGTATISLLISVLALIYRHPELNRSHDICTTTWCPSWLLASQLTWSLFLPAIETICSAIVLFWMYRARSNIQPPTISQSNLENSSSKDAENSQNTGPAQSQVSSDVIRYRRIALRIAAYPIVSLLITYSITALELTTGPADFGKKTADSILYGVRVFAYGILAAFDPSFVRAIREVHRSRKGTTHSHALSKLEFTPGMTTTTTTHVSGFTEDDVESQETNQSVEDPGGGEDTEFRDLERRL